MLQLKIHRVARHAALLGALLASVAGGAFAQTAAAQTAKKPDCFSSVSNWFYASATACPLSAYGVTVYGVIDVGGGYETHAARFNGDAKQGVGELISKVNNRAAWQAVPNGLNQSAIGIKIKEQIVPSWYLIGDVNAGFDPLSLKFSNGPKSLIDNTNIPLANETYSGDSARSTGWDNTRGYVGLSNAAYGVLTVGRQNSLSNDLVPAYDPFGTSYAFSGIGNSSTFVAGTGDTELSRYGMSVKYQGTYKHFRASALTQIGGYAQANNAESGYQFDLGGDFGGLSIDGLYAYAKDAVTLSNYTSGAPTPDTLKATLANVSAGVIAAKYNWRKFTAFGGYEYAQLSSPSDLFGATATATGRTLTLNGGYPAVVQANVYANSKIQQVAWLGGRYSVLKNLDFNAGYYYVSQNNYTNAATKYNIGGSATKAGIGCGPNLNPAITGATPQGTNAAACAGSENIVSGELDWRPLKRIDLYGGVMYSAVSGGLASGFIVNNNTAFTSGVRFSF
ncbi:MAG TPA: porin [Caulobacteraceae bacterium]|nr:porin [Caulobacteraceae bacterium]